MGGWDRESQAVLVNVLLVSAAVRGGVDALIEPSRPVCPFCVIRVGARECVCGVCSCWLTVLSDALLA